MSRAITIPAPELPSHLKTFPRIWPFPRGDLYHWINVLNRIDDILATVIEKYDLNNGPQTKPFSRHALVDFYANDENKASGEGIDTKLNALGFGPEGDRELVDGLLNFSRLLLEKCGNRSLYSSSERLGDLLNTTSLSLLQTTLRLALCLAQRYHSRHRGSHLQPSLLATHYNIDLEKLLKIAVPFPRPLTSGKPSASPAALSKVKEKGAQTKHNANDLISLMRENDGWDEWGHIRVLYYPPGTSEQPKPMIDSGPGPHAPSTPTPLRRSHTHPTPRLNRPNVAEDSPGSITNSPAGKQEEPTQGGKILDIPYAKISSLSTEDLLESYLGEVPPESKYELLHKIRIAQGLATSRASREQTLAIRLLAITNLAFIYPESIFQQKILLYDMEQPKRLQLAYQIADLVHLSASGDLPVARNVQAYAFLVLEALARHKARAMDVCAALSINVNHGILMFLTRKVVHELGSEDSDQDATQDEWRDAFLTLLRTLPGASTRTPETLVAAGIIPLFVDILNLRTDKARRVYSRIMEFLDTFVHAVRDTLATLTAAKGFDAISDLIEYETKSSYENVTKNLGVPSQHKTPSMDYQIPYFQQQTLRWMFRFVNHIMQHSGGGFDRVLRNLIDSPQLLTSLRLVLENARVFGSHVWSNAVNILSSFIHNEPTSYAVIAEAGLSKSLLQAVTQSKIRAPEKLTIEREEARAEEENTEAGGEAPTQPPTEAAKPTEAEKRPREYPLIRPKGMGLANGVLTAPEALSCIPSAFGAICLNASGLQLFQSSHALESFFEIFENPEHVKCLKEDPHLVRSLGTTFDELVRHHPALKTSIMSSIIVMVARVGLLCRSKAWSLGMGTKLWTEDSQGKPSISGDLSVLFRAIGSPFDVTSDEDGAQYLGFPDINASTLPNGGQLTIGDLSQVIPSPSDTFEPKDQDEIGLTATDYLYPVMRFLGAFFENQSNCTYFIENGGVEFILDFATLQSLPFDFHHKDANQELTVLVHMLVETKPHLVIPSLINRAQTAVDRLSDFWSEPQDTGFFTSLIQPTQEQKSEEKGKDVFSPSRDKGTYYAKHMGAALVLTDLLREIFSMPLYQTRPSQQTSAFLQVNLADKYCTLVEAMGRLNAACVWEEILLERNIPDTWDKATKVQGEKSHDGADPFNTGGGSSQPTTEPATEGQDSGDTAQGPSSQESKDGSQKVPDGGVAFKNVRALRYLLSSLPSSITGFLHNLGLGLIGKKKMDLYQKQNATMVADSIAGAVLQQLKFSPPNSTDNPKHRFAYLIVVLSSFSHLLLEGKLSITLVESEYMMDK